MKKNVLVILMLILAAATCVPVTAQESQAANGRPAHLGMPVDWSFRQVMHHSANTPEFTSTAQNEPRVLYNWTYRHPNAFAKADAQKPNRRLKVVSQPKSGLKVDWNAPLGIGTVAPNMFPAKYTFDLNATPSCASDYVVYALNVQGSSAQPNLVAFNNLYAAPAGTAHTIGAGGAVEAGTTVTITTTAAHGLLAGDTVVIAGLGTAGYNGSFVVTAVPTTTTFQYTDTAGLSSPSTGTGTATRSAGLCGTAPTVAWAYNTATSNGATVNVTASPTGAVEAGSTVTMTTLAAHNLSVGQKVVVSGVAIGGFNGEFTVTAIPTGTTFQYTNTSTGLVASGGGTVTPAQSTILTSPALSLAGDKVAFVESVTTSGANDCGTGIAGPCSIFHVLTIGTTGSNGSFTAGNFTATSPGSSNNASMASLVYSSTTNTLSSPWVDYGRDNAYVADDNGRVYEISCVFGAGCGGPAFASGFAKDTGISVTATATKLTAPVLFTDPAGASSFKIFIGGSDGNLYMLPLGTCLPGAVANCVGKLTKAVGDGTAFGGIVDSPMMDPIFQTVFASTGTTTGGGNGAVVQTNFALTTLATLAVGNKGYDVHQGALDNDYYMMNLNDATVKGHFYAAGPAGGNQLNLYSTTFTKGAGNLTVANPPIFGAVNGPLNLAGHSTTQASPMTEVFSNGVDNLIFGEGNVPKNGCSSVSTNVTDGCMYRFNITSGTIPASITNDATAHGSPSGAVVDNVSTAAQASSIYFSNSATTGNSLNAPTCLVAGTTPAYCAVKLTQSSLQ